MFYQYTSVDKNYFFREEKHERTASEFKKKPTTEIHSCRDAPKLNVDNPKVAGARSDVSLAISPRAKPRSRISRPLSKNLNESERLLKNHARDTFHEKVTIESIALRALEAIIKTAENNEVKKDVGNATLCSFQNPLANETCPVDPRRTGEPIAAEEGRKVNEEEPTRDIDSEQYKKSQLNERFLANLPEKEECSLIAPVLSAENDTKNVGMNENFGHVPSKVKPNVSLEAATSCRILDFNTMSVETDEVGAWRSSDVVSGQKCKDKRSKENPFFVDDNENLSIIKAEKARMNSHAVSLSMLKGFLHDQGIDVDLVSKAERYLKDKRKARKGLRKKSISIADVSSCNVEHDRHFERRTVLREEHSWAEKLEKGTKKRVGKRDDRKCIEKNTEKYAGNDTKTDVVRSKGEIPLPKTRDATTCTMKNSNNACTQTVPCRTASKCSQAIFKNDGSTTEKTQTKVERRNACTMTESPSVGDNSAETVKICRSCKSVITERLGDEVSRNISTGIGRREIISENESEDSKLKIRRNPKGSESREHSKNKIDKTSSRECSLMFQKLSGQTQQEREESNESLTSVDSSKSQDLDENASKEEDRSPVRIVSSGIVAALQVAAIRARNVYRAFDIQKRISRSNRKKLRRESRQRKKLREEEQAKRVVDFEKQAARRGSDSKKKVVEVLRNLERAEITSKEFFDETLSDSRNESDNLEDDLDLVDTPSTSVSTRLSFMSIDLDIPRRSSSSVVLRNVRSLMEFLLSETDDATLERIEPRVEKRSSSTRETKFSGTVRMEVAKVNGFLFFSRENLLLLVYGMLCSVVFWCLNFTITCDVVL